MGLMLTDIRTNSSQGSGEGGCGRTYLTHDVSGLTKQFFDVCRLEYGAHQRRCGKHSSSPWLSTRISFGGFPVGTKGNASHAGVS